MCEPDACVTQQGLLLEIDVLIKGTGALGGAPGETCKDTLLALAEVCISSATTHDVLRLVCRRYGLVMRLRVKGGGAAPAPARSPGVRLR
eukprot:13467219-Alexandrium_andersonii.AAC.1